MDGLAIKEAFDAILYKGCLFSLAGLSVLYLLVKCGFRKEIEDFIKKTGPFFVIFFFTWAAWAFISSFPTQEEKEEILKAERRQEEIKKAWGEVFAGGMVDAFNRVEQVERVEGGIVGDSCSGRKEGENSSLQLQLKTTTTLTATDFERGFVLTHIGTNEVFDFSAPTNAVICDDWLQFGAAEDWVYLESGEHLRVHSDGWLTALAPTSAVFSAKEFYPFKTTLGIAPLSSNAYLLTPISCFWHECSPSNTLVMTWQNALFNRLTDAPISFQIECFNNGNFVYRYDLASIRAKLASGEYSENWTSNILIGAKSQNASASLLLCDSPLLGHPHSGLASLGGYALKNIKLSSLLFSRLDPTDSPGSDRDGDGLTIEDELFIHRTDPYNADSDYDGLPDHDEIFIHSSDPNNPSSIRANYPDGIAAVLGSLDPFSCPAGSTNTVYEHFFYTGTTNAPFAYPQSTEETAVLKVSVSGSGSGRLVVGDKVVPILGSTTGFTNTLLLAVEKGVKKTIWFSKPEGLDVAIDSDDFLIGELPAIYKPRGWIVFPHTEASIPCIHDFKAKGKILTLVHGEEFAGMTAMWASSASDIAITNRPPCSVEVYANFKKNQTREISYTVNHPKQLNSIPACFVQELRFCPQFSETDEPNESGSSNGSEDDYWNEIDESLPAISDDTEDVAAFTNIVQSFTSLIDVLYLYRDNVRTITLEVPEGEPRRCCPCPEHWKSNYVSKVSYTDKVAVSNANGSEFKISYEPCSVTVSGVSPSKNFKDATVNFITNGVSYKRIDYTVLGVKIARGEYRTPIERYNTLSPALGLPVEVSKSPYEAESLVLKTDVLPTNGYVKVSLECDSGDFQIWVPGWYDDEFYWHDYEKLLDSDGKTSACFSMKKWRSLLKRYGERSELEVRVVSSVAGSCKLKLEYIASDGTNYVYDIDEQKITSVNPLLLADYNRDGAIGINDVQAWLEGRLVYFWRNDDKWKNDDAFDSSFTDSANSSDNVVNGRNDLINFLPIAVNIKSLTDYWGSDKVYYQLNAYSSELMRAKICFADISHAQIGDMPLGNDMDINGRGIYESSVSPLGGETILPQSFVSLSQKGSSTLLMEFLGYARYEELFLNVYSKTDNALLYSSRIKLHIGDIEKMIGWQNLRSAAGGSDGIPTQLETKDWPTSEHKPGNIVFVHGYNMAEDAETPLWAKNVFKKLWWAGLDRGFIAVQWHGNEGQVYIPFEGFATPNYYGNVQNAFVTAPALKSAMDGIGGPKWFLAHSLGNMLVSAAIHDYKMPHEKYFMLNAAVAMEAYEPIAGITQESHDNMTPEAWIAYPDRVRATHWYELFPEGDGRRLLTWKGRFANVTNIVNFYSTQEEVVNNGDGAVHSITERNCVWYNQETHKGNWAMMLHANEGGWAFNGHYDTSTNYWIGNNLQTETYHLTPAQANALADGALKTKPFFQDFANEEMYSSTNGVVVATNYLYRAEMLAYAIPSESYAVGANPLPGLNASTNEVAKESITSRNFNMAVYKDGQDDLPKNEEDPEKRYQDWQHSTFVQRSYKRVNQLYKQIIKIMKEGKNDY